MKASQLAHALNLYRRMQELDEWIRAATVIGRDAETREKAGIVAAYPRMRIEVDQPGIAAPSILFSGRVIEAVAGERNACANELRGMLGVEIDDVKTASDAA